MALSRAQTSLFAARTEQQQYVVTYLGTAPTLDRMATLPDDPEYRRLGERVRAEVEHAEAAEANVVAARPLLAGLLSGTLADHDDRNYASSYSEQVVVELAACARERLNGTRPTSTKPLDACDPKPTIAERVVTGSLPDPTTLTA